MAFSMWRASCSYRGGPAPSNSGSEQESDEVPDWRGFQNLRLSAAAGGFAAPALSAADCPTACHDRSLFQADAASQMRETGLRATGNYSL